MAQPMEIDEVEDVKSPEYLSDREEDVELKFDPLKVKRLIIGRRHEWDAPSTFDEKAESLLVHDVEHFAQYMRKLPNVHSVEIPINPEHNWISLYRLTRMDKGLKFFEFHKYPQIDTLIIDAMTFGTKELPYVIHPPNLNSLSFQYNRIGDAGAKYLAKKSNLLSLDIRHNDITDRGARYFLFNKTLVELKIAEGNNVSTFLLGAIEMQIEKNRHVLQTIRSIAPVVAGALAPQLARSPLRYSMLDLTKEISRMLGQESLARTQLSQIFTIDVPLSEPPKESIVGIKRKLE